MSDTTFDTDTERPERLSLKRVLAGGLRMSLPLRLRLGIASRLMRHRQLAGAERLAETLIADQETANPKLFHKFVWEHHFSRYGAWYGSIDLFKARKLNGSRESNMLFMSDLRTVMRDLSMHDGSVYSVLDIGCSLGYMLRQLEREVFPTAEALVGIDIDREAVRIGRDFLGAARSRVQLLRGDLEEMDALLPRRRFDFSMAAGSLSYLDYSDARRAVLTMLTHTDQLVAFVGLANKRADNANLRSSVFDTERGNMWVHNFEAMIVGTGWEIVHTRWRAPNQDDQQGLYFVFASPLPQAAGLRLRRTAVASNTAA
jgi:SAM-dependent methyltransferase